MNTTTIALSLILGLLFIATGGIKVLNLAQASNVRDRLGLSPSLWRVIGVLEAAGGVGLLVGLAVPVLGVAAALGLALLMIGAIISRLKVRDPATTVALDVVFLVLVFTLAALQASA
ncbi:DoxX family protein [Actinomadura alba]|uniref:DoxX family protein n=1 Tax=Actinomadura alba TaxID=406431 RepID=UPI001C9C2DE1|nr:DoxX family protein [Actinomadura alba]